MAPAIILGTPPADLVMQDLDGNPFASIHVINFW
jgi:hypothetical protein